MFSFTFELITLAVSNPLVLFCFCNLIIGFLLVDSSKSSSNLDDIKRTDAHCKIDDNKALTARKIDNIKALDNVTEAPCVGKALVKEYEVKDNEEDEAKDNEVKDNEEDEVKDNEEDEAKDNEVKDNEEDEAKDNEVKDNEEDEVKDNEEDEAKDNEVKDNEEDEVKDNEEDDELKRRVEEFIEKINRAWKAEKLGSSALVQSYGHSNTSAPITGV